MALLLGLASPTDAHPLGNFTVNRYARIEVSAGTVRIYYVLDEAELPAFQERAAVAADRSGFEKRRVDQIAEKLTLKVNGENLPLTLSDSSLDQPKGQAGLKTLRVAAIYTAVLPPVSPSARLKLEFADRNEPDRVGWREIVAVTRGDAHIFSTSAAEEDVSDELRSYPGDLIQAPLDLRDVEVNFSPGSNAVAAEPVPRSAPPPSRAGGAFADLITRQNIGLGALLSLFGAAFLLGAGHAVLPGHGKTVMGAYLIGTKGRPVDAVLLGLIVSFMHTASVLLLGIVLFRVNRAFALDRIYPVLTFASGLLAMAFGGWLLHGRLKHLRAVRAATNHDHTHTHDHQHDHEHDHVSHGEPAAKVLTTVPSHQSLDPAGHVSHGQEHAGHSHATEHAHGHEAEGHAAKAPAGAAAAMTPKWRSPSRGSEAEDGCSVTAPAGAAAAITPEWAEPRHGGAKRGNVESKHSKHDHIHGPGGHTHELPEDVAPLSRRGLVVIATSGGIVPSPSAVVVVVSAFSLGRPALGLSLIGAFSVGLAATLTGIGLGLVYGRTIIERRWPARSLQVLPVIGAAALIGLGLVLALRGVFEF